MAAANDREPPPQLLRELYFNRTGIVFLLMALLSVLMLIASAKTHGSLSQFWLALGSATIATTGYSSVQVLLTTGQFNRFLSGAIQADIKSEIASGTKEALEIFRTSRNRYLPAVTYPPQSTTNPKFNRELNESLNNSSHYIFCGMSARYAIARLALLRTVPRDVKLIVADPTKPAAVDYRARHETASGDEEAFNNAKQRILDGIYMSIAGAYQIRHKFDNLEFYFTSMPHVDRFEICDNDIYLTRFSDTSGTGTLFPATAKFDHDSLIYQMFSSDCNSLLRSPYLLRLSVPGNSTEGEFLSTLHRIAIISSEEQWEKMKASYREFQETIRSELIP